MFTHPYSFVYIFSGLQFLFPTRRASTNVIRHYLITLCLQIYHGTFLKYCLFILCETTPEILGPWEELEFTAMGTILLIFYKFSTSSTTNHFSVFPTKLKDRFHAILHVHRFRLSGSSCSFL